MEVRTDETTGTEVSCRLRDKGRQKVTVTTVCGSVELLRKRWMSAVGAGCQVPLNGWLGIADEVITRECCRWSVDRQPDDEQQIPLTDKDMVQNNFPV